MHKQTSLLKSITATIGAPDGQIRTLSSRAAYFQDEGTTPKFIGANWDITEDVALEEGLKTAKALAEARNVELEAANARIETQARHDTLTGLPNRRYLDQVLREHCDQAQHSDHSLALLHLDLDRFKRINDTPGHAAGDAVLVHVTRLLAAKVGAQDFGASNSPRSRHHRRDPAADIL